MRDAFDIRSHVPLLAGNLYALSSQGSMAFKLPSFRLLQRSKPSSPLNDFPQFSWNELTNKEEIGRGSFGCVFTAKTSDGESVVVKKLLQQQERERRLFLKEARILKSLHHKNIVEKKAICENPLAIMLEYVFFDFAPFGLEGRVSSLQDYLDYLSAREEIVSSFVRFTQQDRRGHSSRFTVFARTEHRSQRFEARKCVNF